MPGTFFRTHHFPSSIGLSPWDCPLLFNAAFRILDVVNPGQTHITFTPLSINSVRNASSQPFTQICWQSIRFCRATPVTGNGRYTYNGSFSFNYGIQCQFGTINCPEKLISITFFITSTSASFNKALMDIPALLISISMPPKT